MNLRGIPGDHHAGFTPENIVFLLFSMFLRSVSWHDFNLVNFDLTGGSHESDL
jgi:hypothetical protein